MDYKEFSMNTLHAYLSERSDTVEYILETLIAKLTYIFIRGFNSHDL
jgi:hypothetical protein